MLFFGLHDQSSEGAKLKCHQNLSLYLLPPLIWMGIILSDQPPGSTQLCPVASGWRAPLGKRLVESIPNKALSPASGRVLRAAVVRRCALLPVGLLSTCPTSGN